MHRHAVMFRCVNMKIKHRGTQIWSGVLLHYRKSSEMSLCVCVCLCVCAHLYTHASMHDVFMHPHVCTYVLFDISLSRLIMCFHILYHTPYTMCS